MVETCIYQIVNNVNGKSYIGSAMNFRRRKNLHLSQLRRCKHPNIHLQRAWSKYGSDTFEFKIIKYVVNPENLLPWEQFFIDMVDPEYNICKVAGSQLRMKRSDETKIKHSKFMLGKQYALGYNHTNETKIKLSKPVLQYNINGKFIKEWCSTIESERQLNINHSSIIQVCKGKRKTAGGFIWKYKGKS